MGGVNKSVISSFHNKSSILKSFKFVIATVAVLCISSGDVLAGSYGGCSSGSVSTTTSTNTTTSTQTSTTSTGSTFNSSSKRAGTQACLQKCKAGKGPSRQCQQKCGIL